MAPSNVFPGRVIRQEGTTEDYTVEQVVGETVFARNSGGTLVQLQLGDILGNYAYCYPPGPPFDSLKLNESLCTECILDNCPDDLVCQGKCDGSWFNLLFCTWTSGVCVPDGTASACE